MGQVLGNLNCEILYKLCDSAIVCTFRRQESLRAREGCGVTFGRPEGPVVGLGALQRCYGAFYARGEPQFTLLPKARLTPATDSQENPF